MSSRNRGSDEHRRHDRHIVGWDMRDARRFEDRDDQTGRTVGRHRNERFDAGGKTRDAADQTHPLARDDGDNGAPDRHDAQSHRTARNAANKFGDDGDEQYGGGPRGADESGPVSTGRGRRRKEKPSTEGVGESRPASSPSHDPLPPKH